MYKIEMTRTTSGEVVLCETYVHYTTAFNRFGEICDEMGYIIQESPMQDGYVGGGHGYDYIVTLEQVDEDDSEDQTQYKPF